MTKNYIIRFVVFYCSLLIVNCSLSFAQWAHSPDSNLLIGYGQAPRIISDENGGCFVNWFTGSHSRIQKVDKWGFTKWTPGGFYAGGTDTCAQDVGHMAYDGNSGVYVSFMDICCIANCGTEYPTETYHCMVQHIDSAGNKLWGIGMEPSTKPHYQCYSIALVPDDSGGVYVAFSMDSTEYGNTKIYLQRLDAQGNRLWGDEGIDLGQISFGPMISDGNGGIIYCTNYNYLHRRNKYSELLWSPDGVQTPQGCVDFVIDTINQSIYIRNGGGTLKANRLSLIDASTLWGSSVIIDTLDYQTDGIFNSISDEKGNFWISFYKNDDLLIQKINKTGNICFPSPGISPSSFISDKGGLVIQISKDSSILALWLDHRNGAWQYFTQKIDNLNSYLWYQDVQMTPNGFFNWLNYKNVFISDNNGGAILTSEQDFGIYVQQVNSDGQLGNILSINEYNPITQNSFEIHQNYPNPFNSSTTIEYEVNKRQKISITLYNILGQKIKTVFSDIINPGIYKYQLNMDGLASGLYLYRIDNGQCSTTKKLLYLK